MPNLILKANPLTKEAFAMFGDVIELEGAKHFSINDGNVERFHDLAAVMFDGEQGGKPIISLFKANGISPLPLKVTLIERHPKGSQAFIPMHNDPMVVVVARKGDDVSVDDLHAFISNGNQGVNYHTGVWHVPLVTTEIGQLALIVDRGGPGENYDELLFEDHEILVELP
jgi:ureidoglycolate lyase